MPACLPPGHLPTSFLHATRVTSGRTWPLPSVTSRLSLNLLGFTVWPGHSGKVLSEGRPAADQQPPPGLQLLQPLQHVVLLDLQCGREVGGTPPASVTSQPPPLLITPPKPCR